MFTDSHSALIAALLLPGTYFICQALALVMRLTLGHVRHRAWRIGTAVAAVLYTLVLSAHVPSLEHTFSKAPAEEVKDPFGALDSPGPTAADEAAFLAFTLQPTDCGPSFKPGWDALPKFKKQRNPDLKGKSNDLIKPLRADPYPSAG